MFFFTGQEFSVVQKEVSNLLNDRILVGHALRNDLKCLFLSHPKKMCRDTSKFKPFRTLFGGKTPSLRKLTKKLLDIGIQQSEHSSVCMENRSLWIIFCCIFIYVNYGLY